MFSLPQLHARRAAAQQTHTRLLPPTSRPPERCAAACAVFYLREKGCSFRDLLKHALARVWMTNCSVAALRFAKGMRFCGNPLFFLCRMPRLCAAACAPGLLHALKRRRRRQRRRGHVRPAHALVQQR